MTEEIDYEANLDEFIRMADAELENINSKENVVGEIDYDANIDEFIRMAEADLEKDSEALLEKKVEKNRSSSSKIFNGSRSRRNATPSPPPVPTKKDLKDLKFEDLFGSPAKKKNKTENHESKRRSIRSPDRITAVGDESSSISSRINSGSAPQITSLNPNKAAAGLDTNQVVIDPFSRIRLYKTSINLYYDQTMTPEGALKDRNMGLQFINLISLNVWYRTKGVDQKNFWTSGVLTRKQSGVRTSAKGNEYVIWEINDLKELEKSWTVFLFGSAGTSTLAYLPIGSVIDLTTPSIMDSGDNKLKFSINNSNQIRHIATAKDFGYCQSKRKDGQDCTAVVNTWECCVCIHHASSELKKLGGKKSSRGKPKASVSFYGKDAFQDKSTADLKKEGICTVNFGKPTQSKHQGFSKPVPFVPSDTLSITGKRLSTRMELQGSSTCGELKRNSLTIGNSSTISFKQEKHEFLAKEPPKAPPVKMPLNLDPSKSRHLTDKDRSILAALGGTGSTDKIEPVDEKTKSFNKEIASRIVANPTAGARNYMRYLNVKDRPVHGGNQQADTGAEAQPVSITRETIRSMKKALDFVKSNGPIKKVDPNATSSKRKSIPTDKKESSGSASGSSGSSVNRKRKVEVEVEFDFESDAFMNILNAKSVHEEHAADLQQEEYFDKLSKREAIENKLLNTFSIPTNAVMCRQCKYVALGQSDFCKGLSHPIRIVKATKRFFKCKDCGNRTMSLDRLPKHPCKNCSSSSWLSAAVGKEKKGPILPSEVLAIRGHEEKYIGAQGSKMFLNLEVS